MSKWPGLQAKLHLLQHQFRLALDRCINDLAGRRVKWGETGHVYDIPCPLTGQQLFELIDDVFHDLNLHFAGLQNKDIDHIFTSVLGAPGAA